MATIKTAPTEAQCMNAIKILYELAAHQQGQNVSVSVHKKEKG